MIGSPETVVKRIAEHQKRLDLFALAAVFRFGAMPHDMVIKSMGAFAAHVMPKVAKPLRTAEPAAQPSQRATQRA
jgi:hypothetical protein